MDGYFGVLEAAVSGEYDDDACPNGVPESGAPVWMEVGSPWRVCFCRWSLVGSSSIGGAGI